MNSPVFVFIGLTIAENIVNIIVSTIIAEHCKIGTICRLNIRRIYAILKAAIQYVKKKVVFLDSLKPSKIISYFFSSHLSLGLIKLRFLLFAILSKIVLSLKKLKISKPITAVMVRYARKQLSPV